MCQFISWIEQDDKVLYLTSKQLKTKKGKELITYCKNNIDIKGHGAIRRYYFGNEMNQTGENKECDDFSSPANFPKAIAKSLLAGDFNNPDFFPLPNCYYKDILLKSAWAEYEKIEESALAEYDKILQPAWTNYDRITQSAWAEYKKIKYNTFYSLAAKPENLKIAWRKISKS